MTSRDRASNYWYFPSQKRPIYLIPHGFASRGAVAVPHQQFVIPRMVMKNVGGDRQPDRSVAACLGNCLAWLAIWHGKWNNNLMEAVIAMDKSGCIVLPGAMRKALHISRLAAFKAEVMGNKVELTLLAAERRAVLKKRRGVLVVSTGGQKFDAAQAVSAMREERF
jgi:hypothetical protein